MSEIKRSATEIRRNPALRGTVLCSVVGVLAMLCSCERTADRGKTSPSTSGPSSLPAEITASTGARMVLIPAGEFEMGNADEIDAKPVGKVSISSFYMDRREVTQEIYEKVVGKNPAKWKSKQNPVERLRWLDAIKYCNALSKNDGLKPCYDLKSRECDFKADGYRLPTEAEWEYACRAGTKGNYYFGRESKIGEHAWFSDNSMDRSHPVGKKLANPFGLYDMAGNVREWCNDWYQVDAYKTRPPGRCDDPTGPAEGEKKVLRGGAWSVSEDSCTSSARYCDEPGFTDACVVSDDCGFRCVRRAEKTGQPR